MPDNDDRLAPVPRWRQGLAGNRDGVVMTASAHATQTNEPAG
ncbi:hypothetical protein R2Q81_04295 [Microbacterium aquimaris]|nr:hypothetical protein [Microbacterium aquimaris]MDZ8275169.1 hypothetical protein [Microbacterium aquimaris]